MATTGAKVMVAAGAVGYMGYLAHQQLQEKQEREAAEKAEKKLRKERQKRWERAAKEWAERHQDGEVDEAEVLRSVMWVELDGSHWFTALTDLIQRSEAAAAQRPARLLSVPVLGEPETPTALAVAAILLMGNSSLLDEHVMLPFLAGNHSITVDMSEFASFGFVLSKVSREGARLLDAWLQDLQKIPTLAEMGLDPADMGLLDDRALDSLFWVCAGHTTGDGRLLYYKPLVEGGAEARARRARSAKTLFAQLGLFMAPAAKFRIMLGDTPGTAEIEVGRRPATKKDQKRFLAMLSEDETELVVSNIPLDGEPLVFGGLEMHEEAGSFAYMRNQVSKCLKPPEPSASLLRTRTALMVEQMHAKVALQMQRRLRKLGSASGWSLEHFAAASGEVDMLRWQPESAMELEQLEPRDILGMLRDNDLSLVEEHRDDLQRKLREELRSSVPPAAAQAGSDEQQARAHLEAEVDAFVDDLLQLMQARLVQTPLSDRDQSPMEVVGKFGIYKKVYLCDSKAEENSGLLTVLLRQSERERNERSDELAEVPWQMVPACAAAYAAFVLVVFLLLPWHLTLTLIEHLPGGAWLLRTLPGPASATVLLANALGAWWWTVACIKQLGACGWEEALAVLARRLHIFAAKRKGWRIPLARDAEALEERCTATLAAWTSRLLRRQMAEAVARGAATEAEALQVVDSAASGGRPGGKGSAALPGDAKGAQAWLSLPCLKSSGSGGGEEEGEQEDEEGGGLRPSSGASRPGVRLTALGDAVNQALNEAHRSVEASVLLGRPLRIEHGAEDSDQRDVEASSSSNGGGGREGGFSQESSGTVHQEADGAPACSSRRQGGSEEGGPGGTEEEEQVQTSVREFLKSHGWGFAKRNNQMVFRRLVKQQQPGSQASGLLLGAGTSAEAAGGASKEPPSPDQQQQQQRREAKQVDPTYRAGPPTGTRQRRKGGRRR